MYRQFREFNKGARIIRKDQSSFTTLFPGVDDERHPIHVPVIKRGRGPYLYDYDENRWVDFDLDCGSLLLGHAPPEITGVMKSWMNRGYSGGYPAVSHRMLADKLSVIVGGRREGTGRWLFYNSPFEASAALFWLMGQYSNKEKGVFASIPERVRYFSPFNHTLIQHTDLEKIVSREVDFVVVRVGRHAEIQKVSSLVHDLAEQGVTVVSDETDFEAHCHFKSSTYLLEHSAVRVFGSYLSSGFPFGCIYLDPTAFSPLLKPMDYETFRDIASFSFRFPLYKMKAVIRYLDVLQKKGGPEALFRHTERFFSLLDSDHFDLSGGIIYMKGREELKRAYSRFRLNLLEHCLYFPLRVDAPLSISYAHSDELLQKCASQINTIFDGFYR